MTSDRRLSLNANRDYEYRGLIASSWDLLRGDTSDWPDRSFFRSIIADDGEPALDVGCGTGRLLLDYLAEGLDVEGVEISPEMLELCRDKAKKLDLEPTLYQQQFETLDLPRKYRTIFIPSSSFQLVTNLTDAQKALERCHHHLEVGGRLVMSIMDLSEDAGKGWHLVAEAQRPQDGLTVRRWLNSTYDPVAQLEHTEDRYELVKDGEVVASEVYRRSPATRGYTLDQITEMMNSAGFEEVRAVSGFSTEIASADDSLFCVFGTRA
jgi:ubiquinone/menaquinone biosynthesis C-methylase UbiE